MVKIKDKNGMWIECPRKVRETIKSHFINLFTSLGSQDWGPILDCIQSKVLAEMNASLVAPVTVEEIKAAALQMRGLKAIDPDGFQGTFFLGGCCGGGQWCG